MLEKPALSDESILDCLQRRWGLPPGALEFLPAGNDAAAWSYRLRSAGGEGFFLKVRRLPLDEVSLDLAHFLAGAGLPEVVAPLPGRAGGLWQDLGGYGLAVYPFVAGASGMEIGLTPAQWAAFGGILRRLHAVQLPAGLLERIPRESFHPRWAGMARQVAARIRRGEFANPYQAELAAFWMERAGEIEAICARTEELGERLRADPRPFVLCHADIHTANLLVDPRGGLRVVDWDQPILAPRERDLMFVVDGPPERFGENPAEAAFLSGYGETQVDPLGLAYYRYKWCVQELGDYGERVFFLPGLGADTLADSVRGFKQLFDPGDVVAGAYAADRRW